MLVVKNPNFLALPPAAARLFEDAAKDSFFSSAIWYDLMAKFGTKPGQHSRLYLDSDVRCQFALASQVTENHDNPDGRILHSLTNAYSCEHRIILSASVDQAQALQQLAECLAREWPAWHRIILAGFDHADPAAAALAVALRNVGMVVRPFFDFGTWYENTAGLSFGDYLANRPAILRNTWRRKLARLERFERPEFSYYDSVNDIDRGIADYEQIYRNSWKPEENFPLFIPALIRVAAHLGALRLGTLHVRGRPAAAQFWIIWQDRACIYKLAHDKNIDDFSPGTILTMRMMELVLMRDKPVEVNFGRGDDPYKKLWLPKRREHWGIAAANPRTLRGLYHALRQTAAQFTRTLRPGEPSPPLGWA